MQKPLDLLNNLFGYPAFRGQQEAVINRTCGGLDSLVIMPTGGGKSVCYQIPAIQLSGCGIVVSPLIALMQDQVRALEELGVNAAYLNSSLRYEEQQAVLHALRAGELDLLYVAPERLLDPDTLHQFKQCELNLFAIDEAHCVSSWGHDFRQDYLSLGRLAEEFPDVPKIALTATADERTRKDIAERLALKEPEFFIDGFDRPNICYSVAPKIEPRAQLLRFLQGHQNQAGIVYCLSRKSVDTTAHWLTSQGLRALPYHAGLDAQTRRDNQATFLAEEAVIMVATIAFGMGIDKPDVRFVVHLDLPKSMEAYYQETGRAGRDGEPADAWMVYGLQDVVRLSRMAAESTADENHKRIEQSKLDGLLGWCEVTSCRRQRLLAYFGEDKPSACGNCDVCLKPPVTWDATETAQKALSCVYRTGQRFGAGHVIDVLRGHANEKVRNFDHHNLSTFGIGKDLSNGQWRSVFRQLVVGGYLSVDHERFGALRLSDSSRPLLKGETNLWLRKDLEPAKTKSVKPSKQVDEADEPLLQALKELRKEIADEAGVPPYVVFHDSTLAEMIRKRPTSLEDMMDVSGVGQTKLDKYGEEFLDLLCLDAPTT